MCVAIKLSNIVVIVSVTYFNSVFMNFCVFLAMSPPKKSIESNEIIFNALIDAVKRCLSDEQSINSAAKSFRLPRSSLQRYVKSVKEKFGQRTPSNMVCFLTLQKAYNKFIRSLV